MQLCCWCFLQPQPIGRPGHSLEEFYPCAEMQSVYSVAKADRAIILSVVVYKFYVNGLGKSRLIEKLTLITGNNL